MYLAKQQGRDRAITWTPQNEPSVDNESAKGK
jgi:hypothetical protein